ncbi:MAG: F0F1 ATP synthase subunit delta, partial [SAR324 cluster bacterium]|nr:F0F1 ATP synthase subunit delta [SAR324 cluster bacterium]
MSQIVIAKRYAKALLNLAEKEKNLETVNQELSEVAASFASSQDLQMVLTDAKISSLVKTEIVNEILKKHLLTPLVSTFLQYLMSKKR